MESKKKQILIATSAVETGGVTSSLLALLRNVDYSRYDIDLIMSRTEGEHLSKIPKEVNILPQAVTERNYYMAKLKKLIVYFFKGYLFRALAYDVYKKRKYKNGWFQVMSGCALTSVARRLKKKYDIAVGYMEGFPNRFISKRATAEKKIAYIHVDYILAGLNPDIDRKMFERFDRIVLVSSECKRSFDKLFPEYSERSCVVENFLEIDRIRELAREEVLDFDIDEKRFNIVTAARLNNSHKALYRGVEAMKSLKERGVDNVRWYVFGEGEDRLNLERLINQAGVEKEFVLMGNRENVYPYIKKCDLFVLTSKYEGKPMAVTEAQILGVPVLTTEYAGAREQINDGVDGIVVDNEDNLIYNKIIYLLKNREVLKEFEKNLGLRNFEEVLPDKNLERLWKLDDAY